MDWMWACVKERSPGWLECLGPRQLEGASCHQRDGEGRACAGWAGGWLFHVGLVRHEMSIRPVSGDAPSMWEGGGDEEESSLRNHRTPLLSHRVHAQPDLPVHRSGLGGWQRDGERKHAHCLGTHPMWRGTQALPPGPPSLMRETRNIKTA